MTVPPADATFEGHAPEVGPNYSNRELRPHASQYNVLEMRAEADRQARGRRIHPGVYVIVLGAYAWLMFAVWLVFGRNLETAYLVAVATGLVLVFFGIPTIMRRMEKKALGRRASRSFDEFSEGHVDINTGTVPAREVLVQVGLIPVALALGATVLSLLFALVRAGVL